jgi:ABC-2 type transport system permease protein
MTALVGAQVRALASRSVQRTIRQPANIVFALVFPLLLLAVNSGGLRAVTHLPGFPTDSYLDFFIAFTFVQGALFATINSGTDLAKDIQTGFLNRLALTPLRQVSLLAGHLSGAVSMGVFQALVYLCVGLLEGVRIETGFAGALVILGLAALITLGFASLGAFLALRTGSGEAVQGMFPLFFILLFLSSMALPRNLIETTWFREVATYNPVSYMIESLRSLIIAGWDGQALALGLAVTAGLIVVSLALASHALRTRLSRT